MEEENGIVNTTPYKMWVRERDMSPLTNEERRDLAFKFVMDTLTDDEVVKLKIWFIRDADYRLTRRVTRDMPGVANFFGEEVIK